MKATAATLQALLSSLSFLLSNAFVVTPCTVRRGPICDFSSLPSDSSIFTSTIETFDGSQIDPIVVSGVFWSSLKAKLVAFIIGQLLATLVFSILITIAASQLGKVGEWVTTTIGERVESKSVGLKGAKKRFIKANEVKYTPIPIDLAKLALCILIDIVGSSSELIPIIGEVTDVLWAPIAAVLMRNLFYGSNVVLVLEFAEEILPFTDILPLATLCWVLDTFFGESDAARALGLGSNRRVNLEDNTAIDVTTQGTPIASDDNQKMLDQKRNN